MYVKMLKYKQNSKFAHTAKIFPSLNAERMRTPWGENICCTSMQQFVRDKKKIIKN